MSSEPVNLKIFRFDPDVDQAPTYKSYQVPYTEGLLLLTAIKYIRDNLDETLAFRDYCCGCSWCLSCTMMVNGKGMRTCSRALTRRLVLSISTAMSLSAFSSAARCTISGRSLANFSSATSRLPVVFPSP